MNEKVYLVQATRKGAKILYNGREVSSEESIYHSWEWNYAEAVRRCNRMKETHRLEVERSRNIAEWQD